MSLSKPATDLIVSERTLGLLNHGLAGALAACISALSLYPIENIKTRLQALARRAKNKQVDLEKGEGGKPTEEAKKEPTLSVIELAKEIYKTEGIKGFYRGMPPYVLGQLVSYGVYFFWYEFWKQIFVKDGMSSLAFAKTATLSGLITSTVTNPFWVVHAILVTNKDKKLTVLETIKKIAETGGPKGFYKGIKAAYILVINPLIQFVVYENLKQGISKSKHQSLMIFLYGALSKAISTMITYPYQTIKTNMYINKDAKVNQIEMMQRIFKNSGFLGFYSGIQAKLGQTVINSALILMIYEKLNKLIKKILISLLKRR